VLLNVLDYGCLLENALSAARAGDKIYLPARQPYVAPAGGWMIDKSLEIYGDGPGTRTVAGTVLVAAPGADPPTDVLTLAPPESAGYRLYNCYLHDLRIVGSATAETVGGRYGITFNPDYQDDRIMTHVRLERIAIERLGAHGINLRGKVPAPPAKPSSVDGLWIRDCHVERCGDHGIKLENAYVVGLIGVRCVGNAKEGLEATLGGGIALYGCVFDGNQQASGSADLVIGPVARAPRIDACVFRNFYRGNVANVACLLNGTEGGCVSGSSFEMPSTHAGGVGLRITDADSSTGAITILPNRFVNVQTAIEVIEKPTPDGAAPGCFIAAQACDPSSIALPHKPNDAPVAILGGGLLMPSYTADPPWLPHDGMLSHLSTADPLNQQLRAYVAGQWQRVDLL